MEFSVDSIIIEWLKVIRLEFVEKLLEYLPINDSAGKMLLENDFTKLELKEVLLGIVGNLFDKYSK
jgi:undecaprenyl pyrophosphate phosphatase UppP